MISVMVAFACGGGLVTWLVIPVIQRHRRFFNRDGDTSQFHHTHKREVSRLGGLGMALAFLIISLAAQLYSPGDDAQARTRWVITCSATAMFLLGFLDDLKPLGARRKLTGQILIALMTWCGGIQIETVQIPLVGTFHFLNPMGCVATIFWLIALPNLINLIDGMDGLAGGIALMLMGLLSYAGLAGGVIFPALCAVGMFGSIIGFLRYNFPPAQIFMGDGGAYFLGFLVAELSIVNSHKGTIMAGLLAPLFVLALPIVDVSIAIMRRGLKGMPISHPDRKHLHHKLLGIGYTPRRAVLTLYFVSLVFLALGLIAFWSEGRWVPVLFGIGCLALIVSARSFSFSREWFSVGRVLGNSVGMRESIHYALALGKWFELEAKNCDSVENLWSDFQLVLLKLGFVQAHLTLPDGRREWKKNEALNPTTPLSWHRHELSLGEGFMVEFAVESEEMDSRLFDHLSEIAAGIWHKAVASWCRRNGLPLHFNSRAYQKYSNNAKRTVRIYVPLVWVKHSSLHSSGAAVAGPLESLQTFAAESEDGSARAAV